jgi:hypothetical protein
MHYAVVNAPPGSQGKPYRFYKFRTLNTANKCSEVDEFSLVYESPDQLKEICPLEDIKAILVSLGHEVPENATHDACVNALHRLVEESAITWSAEASEAAQIEEEPEMAAKKATKKTAAKKSAKPKVAKEAKPKKERKVPLQAKVTGKMGKSGKIKKLSPNPAREGTIRHTNLEVIYNSKTVEDALRDLRVLPKPGGMGDIRFAVANGLIEIIDNG